MRWIHLLLFRFIKLMILNFKNFLKCLYWFHLRLIIEEKRIHVKNKYKLNIGLPTIDLLDISPNLNEEIDNYTFLDGNSKLTDIVLIKTMCKRFENCSFLEIGTFRGETIANIAKVAKDCVSISLPKEELIALGFVKDAEMHRYFSKNIDNITNIHHNSLTFDFDNYDKKFDVIFIDGDHSYKGVYNDTKNAFKLLKDENSIIIWHDYGNTFETPSWEVLAAILDGAPEENRKHIYHVSNTICAIFTKKAYKSEYLQSPHIPNKVFSFKIEANKIDV